MYAQPQSFGQIVLSPQGAAMAFEEAMPVFLINTPIIPITQVPVVGSPSNSQIFPVIWVPIPEGCYSSYPTPFPNPAPPTHSYAPGHQVVFYPPGHTAHIRNGLNHLHKEVSGLEKRCGSNSNIRCTPSRLCHSSSTHPEQCSHHIDDIVIPPSVFTTRRHMRTLDQSLSNPIHGNRNVYICGLRTTTDDDTLAAYASRFGTVETCKAIIDISTGLCKGFGFAKYFDSRCSELCIRGFHKLGYEVGFAQDSLHARLKAKCDEFSTNLYVSNLPLNITESEFCAIFKDYKVLSSRILPSTSSSGFGFARFESRKDCNEIIEKFHGRPICAGHSIQVRYADTPAQKDLKRVIIVNRDWAREHNHSAYRDDTSSPSPALTSPPLRRTESVHQVSPPPGHSWKRGTSLPRSTSALSSKTTKVSLPETSPADSIRASKSTSTVLDDGLGDNGIACHFDSPVVVYGDLMNSITHTVEGHAKQQQPL